MKLPATLLASFAVIASTCALFAHRAARHAANLTIPAPTHLTGPAPPLMLWAWEEPEDLRTLDPSTTGVAFLASRLFLSTTATTVPRRQPLLIPPHTYAEAVIRIEPTRAFADTPALRTQTIAAILQTAQLPGIRSLQLDFDAIPSQQPFYADVLHRVRSQLPANLQLSITALVSWCASPDSWLRRLPPGTIDAAIPMYFRLGQHTGHWLVREPLCAMSLGTSTDEPGTAPTLAPTQRHYLFAPHPFTRTEIAVAQGITQ